MITDIFLYIFSFIIGMIGSIISDIFGHFQIWPQAFLSGLTYFFKNLMAFNILFPIDTVLIVFQWLLAFFTAYFGYKLVKKIFNYFRGSDSL